MKDYEILINKKNLLDKNYKPQDLIDASGFVYKDCEYLESDKPIMVRKIVLDAFIQVYDNAKINEINLYIDSAYRSFEYQENSYKYGFILRYPKKKEKITGYNFEPWHYRFLGKDLAIKIVKSKKTLEEYYEKI